MEITNVNEYIDYVERGINRAKEKGKNNFGTLETKFANAAMAYNAKKYFEGKNCTVQLHECKTCKSFDLIFSW